MMNAENSNLSPKPNVDTIRRGKSEEELSRYFDYTKSRFSVEKQLKKFGIENDYFRFDIKVERQYSPETESLYSILKDIVKNEWEGFREKLIHNEEQKKQVEGYADEAEAYNNLSIRESGLLSSDALKCFEDEIRTKVFFETINKKIGRNKDDDVLEAGTGTGIMAITAARAGAKKVTAIEINPVTAAFARQIVDRCVKEGIIREGQIEIIVGDALKYEPEKGKKFDAFISENIYTGQFHELQMQINNHLNPFIDAKQNKIIPMALINGVEVSSLSEKLSKETEGKTDFSRKDFEKRDEGSLMTSKCSPKAYDIIDFSKQSELGVRNRLVKTVAESGIVDSVTIFSLVQMSDKKGDFIARNEAEFLGDDMVIILVPPLEVNSGDSLEIYISYKAADKPENADIRVKNLRTGKEVFNRKTSK